MKRDYNDPVYAKWRLMVYKRDKFMCQMPNCKCKKKLQAHHIKKWSSASSLRYDVQNGITLCKQCHKEINGHEEQYESLFLEIIRNKK
jgi:5-methylcytosine-specific restriction endonuclease McrA